MKINWKYATLGLCALMVSTAAMAQRAGWLTPFLMERAKVTWTARSAAITNAINSLYETQNISTFASNYKDACRGILGEHLRGGIPVWAQTSQSSACQAGEFLNTYLIERGRTNIRYCSVLNSAINGLERGKNSNEGSHLQPQLDELHSALVRLKGSSFNREGGFSPENGGVLYRDRNVNCH